MSASLLALGPLPDRRTVITCTASDSRGNTSSSSFTVTVTAGDDGEEDPSTPGKVYGYGYMREDDLRYEFAFSAIERASGLERGGLVFSVKSGYCGYHRHSHRPNDHFVSKTVESVTFDGHSAVLFTGTGRWNGRDGYRYEVKASDTLSGAVTTTWCASPSSRPPARSSRKWTASLAAATSSSSVCHTRQRALHVRVVSTSHRCSPHECRAHGRGTP